MARQHRDLRKRKAWIQRKRGRARAIIRDAKSRPCHDCGRRYPYWCMQFHHLRNKKFAVAAHRNQCLTIATVTREIAKCWVLCALCHANRTYWEAQGKPCRLLWDRRTGMMKWPHWYDSSVAVAGLLTR